MGGTTKSGGRSPRSGDAALRGLAAGGPSLLGVNGSMRARDVSRPRPEQLRDADATDQEAAPSGSSGSTPESS